MSEEIRNEEIKTEEKVCKCEKDVFKKIALITTGSFIGCLLALCVFTTFAKPPVPSPAPMPCPMQMQRPMPDYPGVGRPDFRHHHSFDKKDIKRGDFHRKPVKDAPQPPERPAKTL